MEQEVITTAFEKAKSAASISAAVQALNGIKRGGYTVKIKVDREYNEIQLSLFENTIRNPIATCFIDRGHTPTTFKEAKAEMVSTALALLRLDTENQ